jgi:hypothetical protein
VSGPVAGHGLFEELAAGYALDALEPADEQLFLRHARGCPPCTSALAGYRDVAGALALASPPGEPSPRLAGLIDSVARARAGPEPNHAGLEPGHAGRKGGRPGSTAGLDDDPALGPGASAPAVGAEGPRVRRGRPRGRASGPPARGHRPPSRGRRWLRPAAVAAVVALLAGGGTWAGLEGTATRPVTRAALCSRGCYQVVLTAAGSHAEAGMVLVSHGLVWMEPGNMAPDDIADQIYVLWQLTRASRPLAVGSFDVRAGAHGPVVVGALAAPYDGTLAFAVSLEHGRTIPASPSRIAALGQAS